MAALETLKDTMRQGKRRVGKKRKTGKRERGKSKQGHKLRLAQQEALEDKERQEELKKRSAQLKLKMFFEYIWLERPDIARLLADHLFVKDGENLQYALRKPLCVGLDEFNRVPSNERLVGLGWSEPSNRVFVNTNPCMNYNHFMTSRLVTPPISIIGGRR